MLDAIARPFGLLLMFLYNITHNYLIAIVLFTVIVKLLLMPFQMKSKKGMMRQQVLQPEIRELQKKHAGNQQKLNQEMQRVYREAGVSPMSGCLWSLLPLPILLALYQAIRKPITVMMGVADSAIEKGGAIYNALEELKFSGLASMEYNQIPAVKFIHEHFDVFSKLGVKGLRDVDFTVLGLDLSAVPNWHIWEFDWSAASKWWPALGLFFIPILAALFMWLSTKISVWLQRGLPGGTTPEQEKANNSLMMIIIGPVMSLIFAFAWPAAMGVYWIVNSVVSILVDVFLTKLYAKTMLVEFAEAEEKRKAREAELEAKRQEAERRRAENAGREAENTSKRKQQQKRKTEAAGKALEWQRAQNPEEPEYEPSRVGTRRYARGRAYDPERYARNGVEGATEDTSRIDEDLSEELQEKLSAAALSHNANDTTPDETPAPSPEKPENADGEEEGKESI